MHTRAHLSVVVGAMLSATVAAGCSDLAPVPPGTSGVASSLAAPSALPLLENAPFNGRDAGPFELVEGGACGAGLFDVRSHTRGTGTIVGAYSWDTLECFDGNTGEFSGSFTLTSASGSEVRGTYTGHITGFVDAVTATYSFSAIVTGGSGRFAGAGGSFSGIGQANLASLEQSQSFSGSISMRHPGQE